MFPDILSVLHSLTYADNVKYNWFFVYEIKTYSKCGIGYREESNGLPEWSDNEQRYPFSL